MSSTDGLCIYICLFLSIIGEAEGAVSSPPSNTAAEVNGEAIFNCSAVPSGPTLWLLTRDGTASGEIRIATVCVVTDGLQNHYRTEQPGGPTTCSLIVFNITMEQAGVYHCSDSDTYRALLTVLDSSPVLAVNSTTAVVENESVIGECSLNYNGSVSPAPTLRPYFYWTNIIGQNVSSYYDSTTENTAFSQLTVTAARENITSYTCHVYLQLEPTATGGYANNTPTVDMSDSSPTFEVLYPPLISNISSEGRNDSTSSCEISTVTCYATAHPTANYTWIDIEEPTKIIYGPSYGCAEFGRNYNCSATNIIRTNTYTDVKTHEERNEYSTRPPCKGCRDSTMNITGETCTNRRCSCLFECDMTVVCTADAYPEPTYHWIQNGQVIRDNNNTLDNVPDGIYSCVAKNAIDGCEFEARIDIEVVNCSNCGFTNSFGDTTVEMPSTTPPGNVTNETGAEENNEDWMIIVGVMLVYEIANLISMGFFLAYYNIDADRNTNESNRNVATHKRALNNRFPWLERMLPCMNQSHENAGKNCLWIFLFGLIIISCGVFIFPILIIIVNLHGSQGVFKRSDSSAPGATKPTSNSEEPQYQDLFKETPIIGSEYEELRHYTNVSDVNIQNNYK